LLVLGKPRERSGKETIVEKWMDTEQGNVELLGMKTLSEMQADNEEPSPSPPDEEVKKESTDSAGVTAGTFGFQGEVVKADETDEKVFTLQHIQPHL